MRIIALSAQLIAHVHYICNGTNVYSQYSLNNENCLEHDRLLATCIRIALFAQHIKDNKAI